MTFAAYSFMASFGWARFTVSGYFGVEQRAQHE